MKIRLFLLSLLFLYTQAFAFEVDDLLDVRDITNEETMDQIEEIITDKSQEYETNTGFNIIEFLNFESDCYITQDEHSHNTKRGGSMFALDVSCKDKSFMIARVPQYITGGYYVGRVWIDKYLWDYITLNFWDGYTLVYGHTENIYNLKEWDRLTMWMAIGKANISGKSSWLHFHTELWKWGKNITFDLLQENEKSYKLRKQRGRLTEEEIAEERMQENESKSAITYARELIEKFEGVHLRSYRDFKGYSIWYWTKSYEWETITKEEAIRRLEKGLDNWLSKVEQDFPWLKTNQHWALISMWWNCFSVYNLLKEQWVSEWLRKSCRFVTLKDGSKKELQWLVRRRNAEYEVYEK